MMRWSLSAKVFIVKPGSPSVLSGGFVTFYSTIEISPEYAFEETNTSLIVMVLDSVSMTQFLRYTRFVLTRHIVLAPLSKVICGGYVSKILPSLGKGLIGLNLMV